MSPKIHFLFVTDDLPRQQAICFCDVVTRGKMAQDLASSHDPYGIRSGSNLAQSKLEAPPPFRAGIGPIPLSRARPGTEIGEGSAEQSRDRRQPFSPLHEAHGRAKLRLDAGSIHRPLRQIGPVDNRRATVGA